MKRVRVNQIAEMCHQVNKAWCKITGDDSQVDWDLAPEWQKQSATEGVLFILANPNAKEDAQHNAWMASKIADGWVYGEVKDAEKKTHPCIVPFNELPWEQQMKDKLFCIIADSLADIPNLMTFGQAIEHAKRGKKVARAGWNGQGMYAYIVPANSYPAQTDVARKEFGEMVPYRTYWALKTAQNNIATWAPSGSDSLAEDWMVVE